MKTKNIIQIVLLIVGLWFQFNLQAQSPAVTIHVEKAGTLSSLIDSNKKYLITELTLTGSLNGTDIRFIREMAGRDYEGSSSYQFGKETNGVLENLDLSGVNIVSGGNYYVNYQLLGSFGTQKCYTTENQMPSYMFYSCKKLKTIILPNSITSIGKSVFSDCTELTSVTFGNSVTSIGDYAFLACSGLTSVTIGNNITSIGQYSFAECTGLTSVTIGNSVTSIKKHAFYSCTGLTSVTFGNSVTSIDSDAFECCTGLKEFIISEQNANFSVIDGVLFNKDKTSLIFCPNSKLGIYTVPNSVTSIGNNAFQRCTGLTSITIPNSVTSIENLAFWGCTGLTNVTIGNSVTSIGAYAFWGCTGLTSVTTPNSVTSIGSHAFDRCSGLINVTIGNSVTTIGDYAFYGCSGLIEIHCKNLTPPATTTSTFADFDKTNCKLYVPKGSYAAYWVAVGWGGFINIIEIDMGAGIDALNSDHVSIQNMDNGIRIESPRKTSVSIYNFFGQVIYQDNIVGSIDISLNKGIYIINALGVSKKVIIK